MRGFRCSQIRDSITIATGPPAPGQRPDHLSLVQRTANARDSRRASRRTAGFRGPELIVRLHYALRARRAHQSQIVDDPFPHLVVHEALDPDYYRQLAADFPAAEIILNGRTPVSNSNFRYTAQCDSRRRADQRLWREFTPLPRLPGVFQRSSCAVRITHPELHPRLESSVAETAFRLAEQRPFPRANP